MVDTGGSGHGGGQFRQGQGNKAVKEVVRDPSVKDSGGASVVDTGDDGAGDGGLLLF